MFRVGVGDGDDDTAVSIIGGGVVVEGVFHYFVYFFDVAVAVAGCWFVRSFVS